MKQPYECNIQNQIENEEVTSIEKMQITEGLSDLPKAGVFLSLRKKLNNNPMKKASYFILIAIIFVAFSCKKETEVFSFYRPSNPQNFKTVKGGELYAFAADDSLLVRADYYLKVLGQIQNYGSGILRYGFTWSKSIAKPVLGNASCSDTIIESPIAEQDTLSFTLPLTNLTPNTLYNIRSFIITDIDTAYNPVVLKVTTKNAIDEWFEQTGELNKPISLVYDAVAFNFGDTVFFGTGNFGKTFLSNNMYMYDPKVGTWTTLPAVPKTPLPLNRSEVTDAVGFAIAFHDIYGPQGEINKLMYIGLGDFGGKDLGSEKSSTMQIYDLIKNEWTGVQTAPFAGGKMSGAVSFVLGEVAYVGTGSNTAATKAWYVYIPAYDRDGVIATEPWQQLLSEPGTKKRTGAVAFTINGRGYFGLGMDEAGNFLNDFWEFRPNNDDPTKGSWSPRRPFPGTPRANASAFSIGDQGYIGTGDNFLPIVPGDKVDPESDPANFTGEMFKDLWRYDPFNDKWWPQADYTSNKTDRLNMFKKVTRGVGYSSPKNRVGFIGFGIVPEDPTWRPQGDLWKYQPFESGNK